MVPSGGDHYLDKLPRVPIVTNSERKVEPPLRMGSDWD